MNFIKQIKSNLDKHTLEVIRKSSASLLVKILGMIVGLVVSIFLGRTIGAEGLGIINLSNQIVSFAIIFLLLGMPNVIVKEVAIGKSSNDWIRIGSVMKTSYIINGVFSVVITVVLILITPFLANSVFNEPRLRIPLIIAIIVMTPQVFSRLWSSSLIGLRKVWQSNLVDRTLSIWFVGISLVLLYLLDVEINVIVVAALYGVGRLVVTLSMGIYWRKLFNKPKSTHFIGKKLIKVAFPLLLASASGIVAANADIIMIGWLGKTEDVGLYAVAVRIALLTSLFLQITNSVISPKLASLYAEKKKDEMEVLVKRVTGGLIIIALLSVLALVFFGNYILSLWGNDFLDAYLILVILSIGQFFSIATGASGLLLIMCGFEKVYSKILVLSVIFNVVLNYFLIIHYGVIGAAISTALTVSGTNIISVIYAKKYVGILTLPFKK